MEKIETYDYKTEVYELDFRGRLTLPTLGNYLLHAATLHAAARGWGYKEMTAQNTTWVLSRLAIEIIDRKRLSEPLKITTWVDSVERIFTNRFFEVQTMDGTPIAYSRSVWAAIDIDTRRPTSLVGKGLEDYIVERACPVAAFTKIVAAEENPEMPAERYKVKYSDLDINGHLNSIKYMEAMLDMFDMETYRKHSISRFELVYMAEGMFGMELEVFKKEIEPGHFATSICHDGKAICRADIQFTMHNSQFTIHNS